MHWRACQLPEAGYRLHQRKRARRKRHELVLLAVTHPYNIDALLQALEGSVCRLVLLTLVDVQLLQATYIALCMLSMLIV